VLCVLVCVLVCVCVNLLCVCACGCVCVCVVCVLCVGMCAIRFVRVFVMPRINHVTSFP